MSAGIAGPWAVSRLTLQEIRIIDATGRDVCAWELPQYSEEQARLIWQAPELLRHATALLADYADLVADNNARRTADGWDAEPEDGSAVALRAAIAHATGAAR